MKKISKTFVDRNENVVPLHHEKKRTATGKNDFFGGRNFARPPTRWILSADSIFKKTNNIQSSIFNLQLTT